MSYVAIARKWRPRTFEDIVGQGHVTRTLQNAIRLDRIHHAFLFTGARGVGKTTCARVLSRALNCQAGDKPTPTPCGECATCIEVLNGSAPDVIEIDGASNNSVDDIRDLRDSVRYLPQSGRRKVYIVDEVHMLSRGAFNALLKTLEEPPPHVVFIFATTEPHKIPDTILSRVQRFDFKRIPLAIVVKRLKLVCEGEGLVISDGGLRLIARAGEGSMRDSQSLLDRIASFTGTEASTEQVAEVLGLVDRGLLYMMLEGVVKGEADLCLDAIEQVDAYGYDMSEFTGEMLELIRNATLVGLSPGSSKHIDVPSDEEERLARLSKEVSSDVLVRSFHVMLDVHDQVARAPRPRLVLEMAVARLVAIRPARGIDQLLERVDLLQRRVLHQIGSGARMGRSPRGSDSEEDSRPVQQAPTLNKAPPPELPPPEEPDPPRPEPAPETPDLDFKRGELRLASEDEVPAASPKQRLKFERKDLLVAHRKEQAEAELEARHFERRGPLQPPEPPPAPPPETNEEHHYARGELLHPAPAPEMPAAHEHNLPSPQFEGSLLSPQQPTELVEELVPPMPVPADTPAAKRFNLLQRYLEQGGHHYHALAFDSALLSVQPPVLRVVSSSDFQVRYVQSALSSPRIPLALELFPNCERIEVSLRPASRQRELETRREADHRVRQEYIAELTIRVSGQPLHAEILNRFSATLGKVVPADEDAPVPSALNRRR
jgi:DNA polymerase-3 subunit gamma/tau